MTRTLRTTRAIIIAIEVFLCLAALTSCTKEDECGTVTDWDLDANGNHLMWIDGHKHTVTAGTWYRYNVGDYICLEY